MKTLISMVVGALLLSSPALAQTATGTGTANSNSSSGSVASAGNSWSAYNKNYRVAPGFAVGGSQGSVGTCMGARGFALSTFWGGAGFSTTYRAKHCETMQNSVRLQALGMKRAAKEVLCYRKELSGAMQAHGYKCRVGKYANGINVRTGGNRPDKPKPRKVSANNSGGGPYWYSDRCKPGQQYVDIRGTPKPCQ